MSLELLMKEKNDFFVVHKKTESLINASEKITPVLMKEYTRTIEQYESMYDSLETFMTENRSKESVEGLINQQISILHRLKAYELEFQNKIR